MHIRKDDNVIVLTGKDKGKTGKILRSFPKENKVLISGVNIRKAHKKARKSNEKGQIVEKTMPVHISNIALIDPKSNKGTRVSVKKEGKKVIRVSKKSGVTI